MTVVSRTIEEIKKKWADMQSLTKKKEAERRRSMGMTGGGPAQEYYFKDWEKVVLYNIINCKRLFLLHCCPCLCNFILCYTCLYIV